MSLRVRMTLPASPRVLAAALEGLVCANCALMEKSPLPPLYSTRVRYQPEPPRTQEQWQTAPQVLQSGYGDCEDLASYRAAELRMRGEPARVRVVRTGVRRWHAIVQRGDGAIEDPSRRLGMGNRR